MATIKTAKNNNVYVPFGNGDLEISAKEATKNISPEWQPGEYNTFPGKNKLKKIDFIKE